MSVLCLLLSPLLLNPDHPNTEKPEPLRKAIEARAPHMLRTARIEFSVRDGAGEKDLPRFYTWSCAEDRLMIVTRGDAKGSHGRDPAGNPLPEFFNKPERSLAMDGQVWTHTDDMLDAYVLDDDARRTYSLHDMRTLGLNPVTFGADLDQTIRQLDYPPLKYETEVGDGLHVVTGVTRRSKFRWWIDPEKDWMIVRTAVFQGDKKIGETHYTPRFNARDDTWFPGRIERLRLAGGPNEPPTVLELHVTEFNRPEHPIELTPASIGVEVGTPLTFQNRRPVKFGYWDGEKAVSFAELMERIETGELAMGPSVARIRARWAALGSPSQAMATLGLSPSVAGGVTSQPAGSTNIKLTFETEWEAYTRDFINRYRLDDEQAQKAWSVCAECQRLGRTYLGRRQTKLAEFEQRLAQLQSRPTAQREEAVKRLSVEREALVAPLQQIFEQQLKPRLDQLPTRAQRDKAKPE